MLPAINIDAVSKRYGNFQALSEVSLRIEQGEFFGLLGPNGAGKTTLISSLAGLVRPSSGRIAVMGYDVVEQFRQARLQLGVVPQELVFDPFFSVRELLQIHSGYYGVHADDDWIDEILTHLDLLSKAQSNMRTLSGGMKRRVLVALALVHRPAVIVLDEPTAGVDVELRQGLWQFIRQLNSAGHTIVLTTHYLEEAEALCGRIAMLKSGKVVALDKTQSLLQRFSSHSLRVHLQAVDQTEQIAQQLGGVAEAEGWLRFDIDHPQAVEPHLAALRQNGIEFIDLVFDKPDLENVFMEVINRDEV